MQTGDNLAIAVRELKLRLVQAIHIFGCLFLTLMTFGPEARSVPFGSMVLAAITCGSSGNTCGGVGDSCYSNASAMAAGAATTPGGKNLKYANGVWVEKCGKRVLAIDGFDNWAYALNPNGRGYSNTMLSNANVAGRACPTHVFVPGKLTATGQCLYYDGGNAALRLDAPNNNSTTDQSTVGSIRLANWTDTASGNGIGGSWYEGNIQTCAAKGMRMPTSYEISGASAGTGATDASPTPISGGTLVPTSGNYATATASTGNAGFYRNTTGSHSGFGTAVPVICVAPGQSATYTVVYDANGGTGTPPTDNNQYATGNVVTVASASSIANAGYSFLGWNTAADGTGTNYVAGFGTFTVGTASVTLYAKWGTAPVCGGAGDSCYSSSAALVAGAATTPGGKSLVLTNNVWMESGAGTGVLANDGLDNWAYALNPDGRSYSASLLNKADIKGRACPTNVFIPGNLVATGKCLYYDNGNAYQRLDAPNNDSVTDQSTVGSIRLANWTNAASGNGVSGSWYEGNIQTCAAKGMRMPTGYEILGSSSGGATDATPTPTFGGTLVPTSGNYATATASTSNSGYYRNTTGSHSLFSTAAGVICVVP